MRCSCFLPCFGRYISRSPKATHVSHIVVRQPSVSGPVGENDSREVSVAGRRLRSVWRGIRSGRLVVSLRAEGDESRADELAEALVLGRDTYEGFAAAWPQMEEQTGDYGARVNGYPKYVASRTLQEPLEWKNSTLIEGEVARQEQQDGKDILVFGSQYQRARDEVPSGCVVTLEGEH